MASDPDTQQYVGMFEQKEMIAAGFLGVKDALEMAKGPETPAAMQTLEARARAAGLQPGSPEYQQFMLQGGRTPEATSLSVGPDGTVQFSSGSGAASLPKTTEGEKSAAGYLSRMRASEKLLDELSVDGPAVRNMTSFFVGGTNFEGMALNERQGKILQAQRDWVRAKLRKESGAVIGADEMAEEIRTYFPLPGEGPELTEQKRQARKAAERQFEIMGGAASPQADKTEKVPQTFEQFAADPGVQEAAKKAGVTPEDMWQILQEGQ